MEILRIGSEGEAVRRWQRFLVGRNLPVGPIDGMFGPGTEAATRRFQRSARVGIDGTVGPKTYSAALERGFDPGFRDPLGGSSGLDWPAKPVFPPLISNVEREAHFGRFEFERRKPVEDAIRILDDWVDENVVRVKVPQLEGVQGAPASARIYLHAKVASQTCALFDAWERNGLRGLVRTWAGSFVPRYVRGSSKTLSSHAWGTAFDINVKWNPLGGLPALRGERGSLRELVPLAHEFGFYWGGHFSRSDGMHFEVARVLG